MAGLSLSSTLIGALAADSHYQFQFARKDDGEGTLKLLKDGAVIETARYANWDDAIPWAAGKYYLTQGGTRFIFPKITDKNDPNYPGHANFKWDMSPSPADRNDIQLHLGNFNRGTGASTGCLTANSEFLDAVYNDLYTKGNVALSAPITLNVSGDYGITVKSTVSTQHLSANGTAQFTISLSGPGATNGVSKDLWFRLDIPTGNTPVGTAKYGVDYEIKSSSGNLQPVLYAAHHDKNGNWDAGYYVKLPEGSPSITYNVHVNQKFDKSDPQTIGLTLNDYFVEHDNGDIPVYSDTKTQPGVLLNKASVSNQITIDPSKVLTSDHLSGGIEGLRKVYSVHKGDTVDFGFQAYTIPDSLSITDGVSQVGTGGFVSNFHSGKIVAQSDSISVIVVGSNAGTAWDLDLTNEGHASTTSSLRAAFAPLTTASALLAPAVSAPDGEVQTQTKFAFAASTANASLSLITSSDLDVPADASASSSAVNVSANHAYLLFAKGQEATGSASDLPAAHVKVYADGDTTPSLDIPLASGLNESAFFFTSSADGSATFQVSSDQAGASGHVQLQVYDATNLSGSIVELGGAASAVEGEDPGTSVMAVHRFGDLSKPESFTFNIVPDASHPLSANDLADASLQRTVSFAAGESVSSIDLTPIDDGVVEGVEGAMVVLDTSKLSPEQAANIALLGVSTNAHLDVRDPEALIDPTRPFISGKDASGSSTDGVIHFTVTMSKPADHAVTVAYATIDDTALAGTDYTSQSGQITFAPGETTKVVDITLLPHAGADAKTDFKLDLLDPFNADLNGNAVVIKLDGTIIETADTGLPPGGGGGAGSGGGWRRRS